MSVSYTHLDVYKRQFAPYSLNVLSHDSTLERPVRNICRSYRMHRIISISAGDLRLLGLYTGTAWPTPHNQRDDGARNTDHGPRRQHSHRPLQSDHPCSGDVAFSPRAAPRTRRCSRRILQASPHSPSDPHRCHVSQTVGRTRR